VWDWDLNSEFALAKQVLYCLNHTINPFCYGYFLEMGSQKLFTQVGFEL
jgi:hypothetical protein